MPSLLSQPLLAVFLSSSSLRSVPPCASIEMAEQVGEDPSLGRLRPDPSVGVFDLEGALTS